MKKRTWFYFFTLAAIILLGQYITFRSMEKSYLSRLQVNARTSVSLANADLTDWISQVLHELSFLSSEERVISFVQEPNPATQSEVTQMFFQFSASTAIYDQIRLLDMAGMEIVRVDYEKDTPVVIPSEALQRKSDRDYFIECKDIPIGGYYISALDLNIENGMVEMPYKPMIRICTPVADPDGNKKGVLVLNYLASRMLEKFSAIDSTLMLINNEGYWLKSPNPDDEWAFMFGKEENFSTRYPEEWQTILSTSNGQFISNDGLWTFSTINPLKDAQENNPHLLVTADIDEMLRSETQCVWKVISHVSSETLNNARRKIANPILLSSLVLYPLASFGIWNYSRRVELEKQANEHTRFMATHDMMTGIFNRAFFEAEISRLNTSRAYPVSIFMIDANNLKTINDTLGHAEGDELIKNIVKVLKESFRAEDIIARLGGDEFAVLLPQTDLPTSQRIFARLMDNISVFNNGDAVRKVDVAIGTATSNEMEDLAMVLKRADERMYAMKASQKQKDGQN